MRPTRQAATLVAAALLLAACSLSTEHSYVQSDDGSLSFRHPTDWRDTVDINPVKAFEWRVGIEAGPVDAMPGTTATPEPRVVAQVVYLEADERDSASLAGLRTLAHPQGADPAADPNVNVVFHNSILDDNGFEGHHMRVEQQTPDGQSVTTEHLAVFDINRARIHQVQVACSTACFAQYTPVIDDLFASIRLKP